jgi:hypothetical protein
MSRVRLYGATSGFVELAAPDVSDDGVLVLPTAAQGFGLRNVVQTVKTDVFTTTSTSFVQVTGFSATITPTFATSKVLVIVSAYISGGSGSNYAIAPQSRLLRGATVICVGDADGSRAQVTDSHNMTASFFEDLGNRNSTIFLDSPGVASAVTYNFELRTSTSGSATFNRNGQDKNEVNTGRTASTFTLIEVQA